ncbi:MAG: DUF551 domain-containing protein [Muribaculaceae bacterium]|nr:DUF551 domain-containing protein [Muribaculaceae bacterium]
MKPKDEAISILIHCATDEFGMINLVNLVDKSIEWAWQHPNWISVEDELPNNYEPVIAAFDRHFARVCFHCGDTWYLDNPPVAEPMYGITHWMPLPQAPKGGEQ